MRCVRCGEPHPAESLRCRACGAPVDPDPSLDRDGHPTAARGAEDADGPGGGEAVAIELEALLGRFHPVVAARLQRLLSERGIAHARHERAHDVELRVASATRDALRAELAVNWSQIVGTLPEEQAVEVLASGGAAPGWFDAPAGGWVDRAGRLVVDPSEHDPTAAGPPRTVGPLLAGVGALVLLLGWFNGAGDGVLLVGAAAIGLGILLPR